MQTASNSFPQSPINHSSFAGRTCYQPPPVSHHKVNLHIHEYASIGGLYPLAKTKNGELIKGVIFRTDERLRSAIETNEKRSRATKPMGAIERAMVIDSRWSNYGHWISEHILRFYYIEHLGIDKADIKFIICPELKDLKINSLQHIGIASHNIVVWEPHSHYICRELLVLDYPQPSLDSYAWFRSKFYNGNSFQDSEKIYIRRSPKFGIRLIENEGELTKNLEDEGFIIITPEDFSLSELCSILQGCKLLVGLNGSGMTNLLMLNPGSTVLELFGQRVHLGNRQIALINRLKHWIGLLDFRIEIKNNRTIDLSRVNVLALKSTLNKLHL